MQRKNNIFLCLNHLLFHKKGKNYNRRELGEKLPIRKHGEIWIFNCLDKGYASTIILCWIYEMKLDSMVSREGVVMEMKGLWHHWHSEHHTHLWKQSLQRDEQFSDCQWSNVLWTRIQHQWICSSQGAEH